MSKVLIGAVVVIIILVVAGYILINRKDSFLPQNQPQISSGPETSLTPQQDSDLGQGGSSYLEPSGVFSMLYPNDWKQDTQGEQHIRFYKIGATQKGQTEIYDGIVLNVEVINLNGQTLSQWVDARLKESTADGTSEIVEPKKSITMNGYPGFEYTTQGLGTFKNTAIQKDTNSTSAVSITTLVADPENVGYQQEVDSTLKTLQLLK